MNAILAALLLLPVLGRAADSKDSILKRLEEIEIESAPVIVEAEKVVRDMSALQEEYETTGDPFLLAARRGSLMQRAEQVDEHADKLFAEYDSLMNRLYGDMIIDHIQIAQGSKDQSVAVKNIQEALGIRAFNVTLHETRKELRDTIKKDKQLYQVVLETARVRRRVRWLWAGLGCAIILIGWLAYTVRRRRAAA